MFYDKEKLKEQIKNPLFRKANEALVKQIERELKEEEAINRVREYLREYPGSSYARVVIDTDVDARILEDLIEQGRIDIRLTSKDIDELESAKREVIEGLYKVSKSLSDKDFTEKKLQKDNRGDEVDKKISGMYSRKNTLKTSNKKKY